MSKTKLTLNMAMIRASGFFLSKEFPENYAELPKNKIYEFIEEYIWDGYDNWDYTAQVYENIEALAFQYLDIAQNCT